MKKLSDFHRDESGVLIHWIVAFSCLFILLFIYSIFMPIMNILINVFVEVGAPLAPLMWVRTNERWVFLIFGVLCIAYPFLAAYRKTYDQGYYNQGGWR